MNEKKQECLNLKALLDFHGQHEEEAGTSRSWATGKLASQEQTDREEGFPGSQKAL